MKVMWSEICSTSRVLCEENRIERSADSMTRIISSRMTFLATGSRPVVGSSNTSRRGFAGKDSEQCRFNALAVGEPFDLLRRIQLEPVQQLGGVVVIPAWERCDCRKSRWKPMVRWL